MHKIGKLTRKRSDGSSYWSYCVIWYEGGGRKRLSLDTTDRPTAEARARKAYADRDTGKAAMANTVGACVTAYLDSLNGLKDEQRKREAWKAAQGFWAGINVADVEEPMSFSYMSWRKRSTNTMRQELSLVRSALHWVLRDKAPKIHVPGIPPSDVGHLTKQQFRDFLEGCVSPHVRLFAILGVTTGARKTALLEAKWDQVDWDRGFLSLNAAGRVQSHKRRATVPLNDRALEALREAKAGATCDHIIEYRSQPLKDIKRGITAAAERTGVNVHPHMIRHSCAVWQAEARTPMAEISSFLGHNDMATTTRIYARFHPDYLRQGAEALSW